MSPAYYNEVQPYLARWLRNLIADGIIPSGDVDERPIETVQPSDLSGYAQCHFFAGIGGWPIAARIAGWPDDREIWTGSPPCQPFSVAGKQTGADDPRHLWPHFFRLIAARRPRAIVGEQVAAATRYGWLDGVLADLESAGYAAEACVLPACAVNAPHRRDRIWFTGRLPRTVGDCQCEGLEGPSRHGGGPPGRSGAGRSAPASGVCDHLADSNPIQPPDDVSEIRPGRDTVDVRGMGHTDAWIECHDGRFRRVKPGVRMLGDGFPARGAQISAFGNAIVPPLAAEAIAALMEVM